MAITMKNPYKKTGLLTTLLTAGALLFSPLKAQDITPIYFYPISIAKNL